MNFDLMLIEIKKYGLDILDIQLDEEVVKVGFNNETVSFIRLDNLKNDIFNALIVYETKNTMSKVNKADRDIKNFFDNYSIEDMRDLLKRGFDLSMYLPYMDDKFLNLLYCESLTDYLNSKYMKVDENMQNLSPLRKLNYMFSQLEENQINVVYYDKENKFFAVEKQGLNGVITVDNFIDNLETFIISIELFNSQDSCSLKEDEINSISINEMKELLKRGFNLGNYLSKLDIQFLKMLYI